MKITKEYIGNGSIKNLKKILKKNQFRNIFYISGKSNLQKPNRDRIEAIIQKEANYFHYDEIHPNPTIEGVKNAINSFNNQSFNAIVALGGGSALDIAKCVSIFSKNEGEIEDYLLMKKKFESKGTPLILIPTTSGTGSEATHFAVIFIEKTKYSLAHPIYLKADYAIIDPELTYTMPKKVTAYTGLDALSQGIESYWNINSTKKSKKYASKSIKLVMHNLLDAVHNPNEKNRYNMAIAANLAGKAINITKTTACHSISYPITSYFKVPHGQAVALTLPQMILYNSQVSENDLLDKRGVQYVKKIMREIISILKVSSFIGAKKKIEKLIISIGLEIKLNKIGIKTEKDIEIIISNGFNPERVKNNPRKLTETNLRKILNDIK